MLSEKDPNRRVLVFLVAIMGIVGAMIPYLVSEKYLTVPVTFLYAFLIVIAVLIFLIWYHKKTLKKFYIQLKNLPRKVGYSLIVFAIVCLITYFGISLIYPQFQITSPHENDTVGSNIIVFGNGAIPGNPVSVWVIDDQGGYWNEGQSNPTQSGEWSLDNVRIGRAGLDVGKSYIIYAETKNNEGNIVRSNNIKVIRK